MTTRTIETSPAVMARIAAFVYLLVIPLGIFGSLYVSDQLIVRGDAAATAANIMASTLLFRLGMVSDMLAAIATLIAALLLYDLLKPVHKTIALAMVVFAAIGMTMAMLNKLNDLAALQLLSGADYLTIFTPDQLHALAMAFLRLGSGGGTISFIFWGLWLFPLGLLVYQSGFLPKFLGVLLMLACGGYVLNSVVNLLGISTSVGMIAALGEVLFILWLLIGGVNVEQWKKRAAESA